MWLIMLIFGGRFLALRGLVRRDTLGNVDSKKYFGFKKGSSETD